MSELEEVVQKVLLEGDEELLSKLAKIGHEGAEHIKEIYEAAQHGAGSFETLANSVTALGSAVIAAGGALLAFTEHQNHLTLSTALLASAMGTHADRLQGIETAFAAAGVSAQVFERFANRLTISIAQEWPEIAASIRTASTESAQSQERITSATLRVRQAQKDLSEEAQSSSSKIAAANSHVESAFRAVQFSAQKAAQEMRSAYASVASATLGVAAAQQRLDELLGRPPSEAAKKELEIAQATQAVTAARLQQDQARVAQQEKQAAAAQKQRDLEQALADAKFKAAKEQEDAVLRRIQLENAEKEAITAKAAAQERATQQQLKSTPAIAQQLTSIIDNGKNAAKSIDLTEVSVQNLERGFLSLAAAGDGQAKGEQALVALSKLLSSATEEQIGKQQRLALVQRFAGTSMLTAGVSTAELLKVLEKGPGYFDKFANAAKGAFNITEHGVHDVEHFSEALTGLNQQLGLVQQSFATALSPALTAIINGLTDSIKNSDGVLHNFIQGIKGIGAVLAESYAGWKAFGEYIDKVFSDPKGSTFKMLLVAIGVIIAACGSAIAAWPLIIGTVVTAIGVMYENWDLIKKKVAEAWEVVKDTSVFRFFERLLDVLSKIAALYDRVFGKPKSTNTAGQIGGTTTGNSAGDGGTSTVIPGLSLAGGGEVDGPGTSTSDSVFARLSRGEFVVKAAAVQAYGAGLFHQLNNMAFPGFAAGGMVSAPARLAGGGAMQPSSTLNLTIGDRTFSGLRGPKSTIDDLSSYATGRQTSAAGSNPSWMK